MNPPASSLLLGVATRLAAIAGEVEDAFTAFELNVSALAAATLLQEVDSGVARRLAEIREYEVVLARFRAVTRPEPTPEDLTLGALDARLAHLREEFISAQESIEAGAAQDAADMDAEMWRVLRNVNKIRQGL